MYSLFKLVLVQPVELCAIKVSHGLSITEVPLSFILENIPKQTVS